MPFIVLNERGLAGTLIVVGKLLIQGGKVPAALPTFRIFTVRGFRYDDQPKIMPICRRHKRCGMDFRTPYTLGDSCLDDTRLREYIDNS